MTKVKVLFVCLGNICRSPLAEAIFKERIQKMEWAEKIETDSCGTSNYHTGQEPDDRTLLNALKNGVTINHRARQLKPADLAEYDLILAMDESNHQNIMKLDQAEQYDHKIMLIRKFDSEQGQEVPDPYFGGEKGFQEVFEILDRSTTGLIEFLNKKFKLDETR